MNSNEVNWNFSDNGIKESAKSRFWNFCNFWTSWNFLMRFSLLCSGEWALSFYLCVFIYTGVSLMFSFSLFQHVIWMYINDVRRTFQSYAVLTPPRGGGEFNSRLRRRCRLCMLKVGTVMFLGFWTDRAGQTVQTQLRLLLDRTAHLHLLDAILLRKSHFV